MLTSSLTNRWFNTKEGEGKRREGKGKKGKEFISLLYSALSLLFITCISLIDDIKIYENKIIAILITKELKNVLS